MGLILLTLSYKAEQSPLSRSLVPESEVTDDEGATLVQSKKRKNRSKRIGEAKKLKAARDVDSSENGPDSNLTLGAAASGRRGPSCGKARVAARTCRLVRLYKGEPPAVLTTYTPPLSAVSTSTTIHLLRQ